MRDTLIIMMGDHGSQIQREDQAAKAGEVEAPLQWEIFKPHAFLLFHYPRYFGEPRIEDAHVLSVDILPTLADFLEYPLPGETDGKSFLHLLEE